MQQIVVFSFCSWLWSCIHITCPLSGVELAHVDATALPHPSPTHNPTSSRSLCLFLLLFFPPPVFLFSHPLQPHPTPPLHQIPHPNTLLPLSCCMCVYCVYAVYFGMWLRLIGYLPFQSVPDANLLLWKYLFLLFICTYCLPCFYRTLAHGYCYFF